MEWNNGKERALFEKEQAKLYKDYVAAGMTEEQIQQIRDYDEKCFRNRRTEARHTQRLNITAFEEENIDDETQNPLLKKFLHNFSIEDKHFQNERLGWIEEIESRGLYHALRSLSVKDREMLTYLVCDGLNQSEIAEQLGVSQQSISKKIKKFKIIFAKWL